MTTALEQVQAEALKLTAADRARLLEWLLVSLDVSEGTDEAWRLVAQARDLELDRGVVQPMMLEDVVARLGARFPG